MRTAARHFKRRGGVNDIGDNDDDDDDDQDDDEDDFSFRSKRQRLADAASRRRVMGSVRSDLSRRNMFQESAWGMPTMEMPGDLSGPVETNGFDTRYDKLEFAEDVAVGDKGHQTENVPRSIKLPLVSSGDLATDRAGAIFHDIMFLVRSEKAHAGGLDTQVVDTISSLVDAKGLPAFIAWVNSAAGQATIRSSSGRFQQLVRCMGTFYEAEHRDKKTGQIHEDMLFSRVINTTRVGQQKCRNYWYADRMSEIDGTHLWLLFKYGVNPLAKEDREQNGSGVLGDARVAPGWYVVPLCTRSRELPPGVEVSNLEYQDRFGGLLATKLDIGTGNGLKYVKSRRVTKMIEHRGVPIYIGQVLNQRGTQAPTRTRLSKHAVDRVINPAPGSQSMNTIYDDRDKLPDVSVLFGVNDIRARNKNLLWGGGVTRCGDGYTYSLFREGVRGRASAEGITKLFAALDLTTGVQPDLQPSAMSTQIRQLRNHAANAKQNSTGVVAPQGGSAGSGAGSAGSGAAAAAAAGGGGGGVQVPAPASGRGGGGGGSAGSVAAPAVAGAGSAGAAAAAAAAAAGGGGLQVPASGRGSGGGASAAAAALAGNSLASRLVAGRQNAPPSAPPSAAPGARVASGARVPLAEGSDNDGDDDGDGSK